MTGHNLTGFPNQLFFSDILISKRLIEIITVESGNRNRMLGWLGEQGD
jgi:hypothetical protein